VAGTRSPERASPYPSAVSPVWLWMQAFIVLFVVIGMVVAAIRLA
jgi:hypothetical protein